MNPFAYALTACDVQRAACLRQVTTVRERISCRRQYDVCVATVRAEVPTAFLGQATARRTCAPGSKPVEKRGAKIHGCYCERKVWPGGKPRGFAWLKSGRAWVLIARGATGAGSKTRAYAVLTPCRRR